MRQPLFVRLSGELDATTAHEWRQTLARAAGNDLALDLGDVTQVDSAFLDALLRLSADGRDITIVDCQDHVARVLKLAAAIDVDIDRGGARIIPFPRAADG